MERLGTKSLILVFLFVSLINNYILSILGTLHVPTGQSLTGRGIACIACSLLGGIFLKEKVLPTKLGTQTARFVFSGFGLWATIESYQFARASEIALISRLDLPLIVIFGFLISLSTNHLQKVMTVLLIVAIVFSIWIFSDQHTTLYGLSLAAFGTIILSVSYLLLNRTARTESPAIVSLTPAIACVCAGTLLLVKSRLLVNLNPLVLLLNIASGVAMYMSYRVIRHFYRRFSFFRAQIVYILIPIFSIPIDIIGFGRNFSLAEYGAFLMISLGVMVTGLSNEKIHLYPGGKNEYQKAIS